MDSSESTEVSCNFFFFFFARINCPYKLRQMTGGWVSKWGCRVSLGLFASLLIRCILKTMFGITVLAGIQHLGSAAAESSVIGRSCQ